MSPARWVNAMLIVVYLGLAMLYACEQSWPKVLYWIGAAVLATGVLLM